MNNETEYLLSTKANKERLLESIEQLSEEEALLALVDLAKEDKENGDVVCSGEFKERLKKRKAKLEEG